MRGRCSSLKCGRTGHRRCGIAGSGLHGVEQRRRQYNPNDRHGCRQPPPRNAFQSCHRFIHRKRRLTSPRPIVACGPDSVWKTRQRATIKEQHRHIPYHRHHRQGHGDERKHLYSSNRRLEKHNRILLTISRRNVVVKGIICDENYLKWGKSDSCDAPLHTGLRTPAALPDNPPCDKVRFRDASPLDRRKA